MLHVRSCAKVNLTLDILSRRKDGYHELQSVVHTVGLWDTLSVEADTRFSLECNVPALEGDDNLCLKAGRLWLETAQDYAPRLHGARIVLNKRIPFGAGLGGGSGNAAAVLLALNALYRVQMPDKVLWSLASRLGADVPFFLKGGCALMEGIGEKLTPLPAFEGWLVLVQPPQPLSTPQIYRRWDMLNRPSARGTASLLKTLKSANEIDLAKIGAVLQNDLRHAAQAEGVDVMRIIEALKREGAMGAEMTGSGSAVFGLFKREETALDVAEQMRWENTAQREGDVQREWRVWVAPFCHNAVQMKENPMASQSAIL
ncbi:MAG: 4-diphosphocytidyl-2-C-methyl-D-erythritol kinase [Abditibacteriota bacterium]|nr:4-diphosphocytidyl-2-C-methyl-D-erythritol kinase [Abditibacteriota bacterium]